MGAVNTIVSHPTGNRNVRAVLVSLHQQGWLAGFHGTVAFSAAARWLGLLPGNLRREFERRRYDLPATLVHAHPARELARQLALRMGGHGLTRHESGWASVDRIYSGLDRIVAGCLRADGTIQAVYAYEDGALATFTRAKELGMARVYDLPIAYWETGRRLMIEEAARLPAWAMTLGGGVKDSLPKIARKTSELELADLVITPSQFVADSLPDWARASKRIVVSPFGSPPATQARDGMPERRSDGGAVASEARTEGGTTERRNYGFRPSVHPASDPRSSDPLAFQSSDHRASTKRLRVLFAGSMGQRKGLGDLFAAMRLLNRDDVELVVMGSLQAPMEFYRSEFASFTYEPGRPHAQVLELMRSCDVFCLPSIVEGRALVMQEAMSQGLPIIITPNTGGADLVCEADQIRAESLELRAKSSGSEANSSPSTAHCPTVPRRSATGFLVPIRSPGAIAEAIAWCADHRAETAEMGRAAQLKAATYTWEAYGDRVVDAIRGLIR